MGFMNWLMKGVGFETEEVYDDSLEKQKKHEEKLEREREKHEQKRLLKERKEQERANKFADKYSLRQEKDVSMMPRQSTTSYSDNPEQYNTRPYESPLSSYGGLGSNVGGYGSKNVEFLYPASFDDTKYIISYLKESESVVLNLSKMNEVDSQRLLDCVSGAIYALNGSIRYIERSIYLLTPEGYNIKTPEKQQNDE